MKQLSLAQRKTIYLEVRERLQKKLDHIKRPVDNYPYIDRTDSSCAFCLNVDAVMNRHGWTSDRGYDMEMMHCTDRRELRKMLPELAEHKPRNGYRENSSFWFSTGAKGIEKRIRILDKILEKM